MPTTRTQRVMDVSDEELRTVILDLSAKMHDGYYAPALSRFEWCKPKGWPGPRTLLRRRGYVPNAQGRYTEAWAELVGRLTGLEVFSPALVVKPEPPDPLDVLLSEPALVDERALARAEALSWGMPVASWREDGDWVYYLLR